MPVDSALLAELGRAITLPTLSRVPARLVAPGADWFWLGTPHTVLINRFWTFSFFGGTVCQFVIVENGDVPSRYLWLTVGAGYWEPFGTVLAGLSH